MSETETNDKAPNRRVKIITAIWLVVSQILGLVPLYFMAIGVMIISILAGCVECIGEVFEQAIGPYPLIGFICVLTSWVLFADRKYKLASIVTAVPLVLAYFMMGAKAAV